MSTSKNVALLGLRFDNNYGGNLQRYALVKILQQLGCNVEYLYIRDNWDDWFQNHSIKKILKQSIKQLVLFVRNHKTEPMIAWHKEESYYSESCKTVEPFLDKYIPHTKPIYLHYELKHIFRSKKYDAIVAGSDQIWRKEFIQRYGLGTFFLDFIPNDFNGARIVYGASFGVDRDDYTELDLIKIRPLFERFNAVSVREKNGIELLNKYNLTKPKAEIVLDPTLLLTKNDYDVLIDDADTHASEKGNMFCYILEMTSEKEELIYNMAKEKGLTPFFVDLNKNSVSIEQWLRCVRDAEFVFTDSYHGLLFSIIFRKHFYLAQNSFNGNTRFESILELLGINIEMINLIEINYEDVSERLNVYRDSSIAFLNAFL